MRAPDLEALVARASDLTREFIAASREPIDEAIRSEIFGPERFLQHARSLAEAQPSGHAPGDGGFFPRIAHNARVLRHAHRLIGSYSRAGQSVTPAAEWLLDNFHLVEAQLLAIREGLPRGYYRKLPKLTSEPLRGLPRIYGIAWAFVAHTDSDLDLDLLRRFVDAYQEVDELEIGELWALPTTLRVVLIENLRRIAERIAANKAVGELADLCCDAEGTLSTATLERAAACADARGVLHAFLSQIYQRLHHAEARHFEVIRQWLAASGADPAQALSEMHARQTIANVTVRNIMTSLRRIGGADWKGVVELLSSVDRVFAATPPFRQDDFETRDQCRHTVEGMARRARVTERRVAEAVLARTRAPGADTLRCHPAYFLLGAGRPELERDLRVSAPFWHRVARLPVSARLTLYLGIVALLTTAVVAAALHGSEANSIVIVIAAVLCAVPASEFAISLVNRVVSESARPQRLARKDYAKGLPPDARVLVVIPTLLTSADSVERLARRLELHYLANPDEQAQFALLTDWTDSATETEPHDASLLNTAIAAVRALNTRYPQSRREPRFLLLHRPRTWTPREGTWMGWERKRGKLEQLVRLLAGEPGNPFTELGDLAVPARGTRFVLTLDSDTATSPGIVRELVAIAAHPLNAPVASVRGRRIAAGHGILQPRVVPPLPAGDEHTLFHWLFSGQCGIDPYSATTSEIYQDLFGTGTFTGKGLLDVDVMHDVLDRRIPPDALLSHDLIEGSIARCGFVSDVVLMEDAPAHAEVAAARTHRWTRGDWQLLPFLLRGGRYDLDGLARWKIIDNLRRSLIAPASLAMLGLALATGAPPLLHAALLVGIAFAAGPMMGALAGLSPSRDTIALPHFLRIAFRDLARALAGTLWQLASLLYTSWLMVDAIARTCWRLVRRRRLLQWVTAAQVQSTSTLDFGYFLRRHLGAMAAGAALLLLLLAAHASLGVPGLVAFAVLEASAVWAWIASASRKQDDPRASPDDLAYLGDVARDTWRYFERYVGAEDHHLPPDNVQLEPHPIVAHRTSPTNIGLYLLCCAVARDLGFIGTRDMVERIEATQDSIDALARHEGHLLNWYDSQTLLPLAPAYVSTVDSGNLAGHLWALAEACRGPSQYASAADRAIARARARLGDAWGGKNPVFSGHGALATAHAEIDSIPALARMGADGPALVAAAREELDDAATRDRIPIELRDAAADFLNTLASHARDALETDDDVLLARLERVAVRAEALAAQMRFGFLYDPERALFHIGYRVDTSELDRGYYDLLASEARLSSYVAICKGEVPVRHWFTLGRPFVAIGSRTTLRSWSGSMFEYLMPSLVMDEPAGGMMKSALAVAVAEQMRFGQSRGLPWGISESAFGAQDHTLAYQYSGFGVPTLALKRSSGQEFVVAPYASALAALVAPGDATRNLRALEQLNARETCGFIDAVDFTAQRQSRAGRFRLIRSFMAHHQAMTLVALCNVLSDDAPKRWFHANAAVAAYDALLQERAPRELALSTPPLPSREVEATPHSDRGFAFTLDDRAAREGTTGHVLSNGRYSVLLFGDGIGWSRYEGLAVTRWRDDWLRHLGGTLFYLREGVASTSRSLTAAPVPDPSTVYRTTFLADRVIYESQSATSEASMTVLVSPEDDIEVRDIVLRNLTDEPLACEIVSYLEPVLATQAADDAHPAFSNLFVAHRYDERHHALFFQRHRRDERERTIHLAHFAAVIEGDAGSVGCETDRRRFIGRNRDLARPAALLRDQHSSAGDAPGLDPVASLRVRINVPPKGRARLLFATAAATAEDTLVGHIDKYRSLATLERASLMSATLSDIRLRELGIEPPEFAAMQALTPLVCQTMPPGLATAQSFERRHLWRHAISGDRPIIVVAISAVVGLGLLRAVFRAREYWSFAGLAVDVVVLNGEPSSYARPLADAIAPLVAAMTIDTASTSAPASRIFVLRREALTPEEHCALNAEARIVLVADGRPFEHHIQDAMRRRALSNAQAQQDETALEIAAGSEESHSVRLAKGAFDGESGEFRVEIAADRRPARPWVNVISNPEFGFQISEAGGGFTWAGNSRLHQLTGWSNDPVRDPASEWFVLDDPANARIWPLMGPHPMGRSLPTRVRHGQGYSVFEHSVDGLAIEISCFVAADASLKTTSIRIRNEGKTSRRLRVMGVAEWVMGATKSERRYVATRKDAESPYLYAMRVERSEPWAGGTAFFGTQDPDPEWTCDRRELYAGRSRVRIPDRLEERAGAGLDPCAAVRVVRTIAPGASATVAFMLGYGNSEKEAHALAARCGAQGADAALDDAMTIWSTRLDRLRVDTPDPLFDQLVNRWLPYQSLSCRLWARAGFYQAGGAYGFRDQLQDAMGLALIDPGLLRAQIVLHASRQFREGDVQHWWHPPAGAGVRTRFSDDRLWLPFACAHYVETTGDIRVLDEQVPFIAGEPIPEGAEDAYYVPTITEDRASVYEHCARAIDVSLRVGAHGLPLMGSGDWNDGMNRVGAHGRGESVWLGWFLCAVVQRFIPLAQDREDFARAARWMSARAEWDDALHAHGWDGEWYRRAYFDDGSPLGSRTNSQCRIDLIAQAWSVLSGAAAPDRARRAMKSAMDQLVDHDARLVRLLDPPFVHPEHDPGYIKDYPPGVRENGGQYAHAGAWAVMALAAQGDADLAYRLFTYLSPAHRADVESREGRYELEPYVMAGDVYTAPPFTGRGGWSWYTGAAAWMHRAAVESLLGFRVRNGHASMTPCLPSHWPRASVTYRVGRASYTFMHVADDALDAGSFDRECGFGEEVPLTDDGAAHRVRVRRIA